MQLPYMVSLPEEGSVFDYYLNLKQYQFVPWNERGGDTATRVMKSSGYVPLPEVLKSFSHSYFLCIITWSVLALYFPI